MSINPSPSNPVDHNPDAEQTRQEAMEQLAEMEQMRREVMEQLTELKWGLLPDAGTMRRLEYTRDGRQDRYRLETGVIYEQSFRELCSLYAHVLRLASLATACGPIPAQPEATWLLSRSGAYCEELKKYCAAMRFDDSHLELANPIQAEGGKPPADTHADRPARDPNQPSRDRQNDILAAIRTAAMPLTRPELIDAMKLKTEGKLGANLAWMVANNHLINIPQRGYWLSGEPVPE